MKKKLNEGVIEMNKIYIENGELNINRLKSCYSIKDTRRVMQSLRYELYKNIITLNEYEECKKLIMLESDSVVAIKEIMQVIEDSY
ncbi:hypothetical protein [Clostridium estertheticum]|uniref:hypothetical protein n=1 Tax=Clostridium estertheticum TaxID=238834 RepID=UPI001C0E00B1|nr:hypothetical protein [Clostridium estertheticum]MBU3173403.1 hypothetical protein [Clostridium estertheticum]